MEVEKDILDRLAGWIRGEGLTELHPHLLGMSSADFWVQDTILIKLAEKVISKQTKCNICSTNYWKPQD